METHRDGKKRYECKSCGALATLNEGQAGPPIKCGACDADISCWCEVIRKTWKCNGCDDGPCVRCQDTKPTKCNVSGDPMARSDDWSEVVTEYHKPSKVKGPFIPGPGMGQVRSEVKAEPGPFRVRIIKGSGWYKDLVGRIFTVKPTSMPGVDYEVVFDDKTRLMHGLKVSYCERVSDDAVDTCPGCRGKDGERAQLEAEIARLENNAAVKDWEIEHIGKNTDAEVNRLRDEVNGRDEEIVKLKNYLKWDSESAETEINRLKYVLSTAATMNEEQKAKIDKFTSDLEDTMNDSNLEIKRLNKVVESLNNDGFGKSEEIRRLKSQLPADMQDCTIEAKQCEKGHGWLTATNWVQYGCPTCQLETAIREGDEEIKKLQKERDKYKRDWNDLIKKLHSQACEITQFKHALECSKGADNYKYKRIEELEAQIDSLRKTTMAIENAKLNSDLKDMYKLVDSYRSTEQETAKCLKAERKKQVTLTLTMDNARMDAFFKIFPEFNPKKPKQ